MAPIATSPPPPASSIHSATATRTTPKPKVTRPLLRRATLAGTVRTREDAGLDLDDPSMSVPPSPTKRARTVTFNPLVQEQLFSSSPNSPADFDRDLEATRIEVRHAIEEHVRGGSDEGYDGLKEVFARQTRRGAGGVKEWSEDENMRTHIIALTSCVSLLGKSCAGLVKAVLECEWVGRDEAFVKAFVHFLGNLASAQGVYVSSVLSMLVDKFTGSRFLSKYVVKSQMLMVDTVRISSGRLRDCPIVNRDQLASRVHMALRYLLRLIPSASSTVAPILATKFPYSDDTKKVHIAYINNLIRLIDYAPELKSEIFSLITERLVKIDVQMQVDLDDLDDEVSVAVVQAISFQPGHIVEDEDEEDDGSSSDGDSVSSEDLDDDTSRVKALQSSVEKMDAILDTLFRIYTPYFDDPESTTAKNMFETLLSHFRNIILPTYRSRHTQFLLFHFAQKSNHLIDTFAGECVDLAFKSGRPAVLKQSAAAYLASFVSRGAHVQGNVVRDVFDFIGASIDSIRIENENGCRGPDLNRYGTFYATTQALLYIFCFRWRDLIISDEDEPLDDDDDFHGRDLVWNDGVKELLIRTIYSKLNPLKICAPSIVEEFAKIAHHLRFMYVYPLLENNKKVRLAQFSMGVAALRDSGGPSGTIGGDDESWHQMDAYFPFDPYQLPVSRGWIEDDYVAWKGIPGMTVEDYYDSTDGEDGGVDLDDDEEEDEEEEDTATDGEEED